MGQGRRDTGIRCASAETILPALSVRGCGRHASNLTRHRCVRPIRATHGGIRKHRVAGQSSRDSVAQLRCHPAVGRGHNRAVKMEY